MGSLLLQKFKNEAKNYTHIPVNIEILLQREEESTKVFKEWQPPPFLVLFLWRW